MTPDDILRMAREAGLRTGDNQPGRYRSAGVSVGVTESDLLAFADLVAAAERERIAAHYEAQPHVEFFGLELADAIRAREKP